MTGVNTWILNAALNRGASGFQQDPCLGPCHGHALAHALAHGAGRPHLRDTAAVVGPTQGPEAPAPPWATATAAAVGPESGGGECDQSLLVSMP